MAPSPAVIDASLAIYSVLNTPYSLAAEQVIEQLVQREAQFFAPSLWWYEVTSVIHRYYHSGQISESTAYKALNLLSEGYGIQRVEVSARSAFDWATRLHQKAAYDGFYMAAAEQLGAEFWTADQSLVNQAREVGISWVHGLREMG